MKVTAENRIGTMAVAMMVALALAFGVIAAEPIVFDDDAAHQAQAYQDKRFKFTHTAYLTNGKGAAYQSYKSYPIQVPIVHKARIIKSKLVVTGTVKINGKIKSVKNKVFTLTKKTKYWKHVGNGYSYDKSSKAKIKKLLAKKKVDAGGDLNFIVKKGKVVILTAE